MQAIEVLARGPSGQSKAASNAKGRFFRPNLTWQPANSSAEATRNRMIFRSSQTFSFMNRPSRRQFVFALGALALSAGPGTAGAASFTGRTLSFDNLHTGEKLVVEYYASGVYVPQALDSVNRLLRDFRTGDIGAIDAGLLDLLHGLATLTGSRRPFQIISGYRSPATNEALRRHSTGVASGSLHTLGQAIDIRLDDVPLESLRNAALSLRSGGVGYYPASNFVHVDTGRLRTW